MDTRTGEISTVEDFGCRMSADEMQKYIKPVYENEQDVPDKIMKLINSGRWEWITKTQDNNQYLVGVRRKSTGEERWL